MTHIAGSGVQLTVPMVEITRQVFSGRRPVTWHAIAGAMDVYLMNGVSFAFV